MGKEESAAGPGSPSIRLFPLGNGLSPSCEGTGPPAALSLSRAGCPYTRLRVRMGVLGQDLSSGHRQP